MQGLVRFRTLLRRLGFLTQLVQILPDNWGSVPFRGESGFLQYITTQRIPNAIVSVPFRGEWRFLQVSRLSELQLQQTVSAPSRGELCRKLCHWYRTNWNVSVPSRGDWGFLPNRKMVDKAYEWFPYPLKVNGGSYRLQSTSKKLVT